MGHFFASTPFVKVAGKKIPEPNGSGILNKSLAVSYFHMGTPTLSSALSRFTSEFGMGSGGTNSLWPPGISGLLVFLLTKSGK